MVRAREAVPPDLATGKRCSAVDVGVAERVRLALRIPEQDEIVLQRRTGSDGRGEGGFRQGKPSLLRIFPWLRWLSVRERISQHDVAKHAGQQRAPDNADAFVERGPGRADVERQ